MRVCCKVAAVCHALAVCSWAGQVTLDGSFGTKGALAGPNYDIPASVGKAAGKNLFHSFGQFDLSQGDVATFSGPGTIQNVLSRVTGGKPSSIDGTIQCMIDGANFYFVNPKGVVFGKNASLDISGSFAVTTADYIKLEDGTKFVATNPTAAEDALLTSASPVAFGFLEPSPAPVLLEGPGGEDPGPTLAQMNDGKTFAIIGGNIEIRNQWLIAPAGQVALVSVGSPGEVVFDVIDVRSPVVTTSFDELGDILMDDLTLIDVSGEGAGRIVVHANNFTIQNSSLVFADTYGADDGIGIEVQARASVELINGGFLEAATFGDGRGGDVQIVADLVHIDGQVDVGGNGGSAIATGSGSASNSGDVLIEADILVIENGAGITASGSGTGSSGNINITASLVRLDGHRLGEELFIAQLAVDSFGDGASGNINIRADSMEVVTGGKILAETHGPSDGGSILIETDSIELAGRGVISAATDGPGLGGNVQITANSLRIDGTGDDSFFTGISSATLSTFGGGGQGGNIVVAPGTSGTLTLELVNRGRVSASTEASGDGGNIDITGTSILLDGSGTGIIADNVTGPGNGGSIFVHADSLDIRNSATISAATADKGNGGNIEIEAGEVILQSEGSMSSASTGTGTAGSMIVNSQGNVSLHDNSSFGVSSSQSDAGSITVTAGSDIRVKDSSITASAANNGGDITLKAGKLVYFHNSTLTAEATTGNGGNLNIDPPLVVLNHSTINANSADAAGGNIAIVAQEFLGWQSPITASGIQNGTITIQTPDTDVTTSLTMLEDQPIDIESLLQPHCGVKLKNISTFAVRKGGAPVSPSQLLPSVP